MRILTEEIIHVREHAYVPYSQETRHAASVNQARGIYELGDYYRLHPCKGEPLLEQSKRILCCVKEHLVEPTPLCNPILFCNANIKNNYAEVLHS